MPEIIEIKKYTDFIKKNLINKKLLDIEINSGRYKKHGPFANYDNIKKHLPLKIIDIVSKGKFMYIALENEIYLGITLGLSGGWFFKKNNSDKMIHGLDSNKYDKDVVSKYIQSSLKHLNVEFICSSGILYFYDQLSFGTITVFDSQIKLDKKLSTLGIDIVDTDTTFKIFKEQIEKDKNLNKSIGNVIVNQKIISGIGNYLRADVLWMSKISPFRKVKDISEAELKKIYNNARLLIWGDYDYEQGIKLHIIKKSDKLPQDYDRSFFIYDQDKDIFGNEILKDKLYEGTQIRYIYWVKEVQQ
jgi:formamidopyrimidine-DNA glycosylase